jgi:hypothetical protein
MSRGSLPRRTLTAAGILAVLGLLAFTTTRLLNTQRQLREVRGVVASARSQVDMVRARLDAAEGKYREADKEYDATESELGKASVTMDAMKRELLARGVRSVRVSKCTYLIADESRYRGGSTYYKGIPPICPDRGSVVVPLSGSGESHGGADADNT